MNLCKQATLFVRKPFFSQFPSSILSPFASEFEHFTTELNELAVAIRDEVLLASNRMQNEEAQKNSSFRTIATKFSETLMREIQRARHLRNEKLRLRLLDACSTYNHQTTWKQARKRGTVAWFFETTEYKQWSQGPRSHNNLWCTGILGSGKTVLSANVVDHVASACPEALVIYFFCRHDEEFSLNARAVVGSIVRQLLQHVKAESLEKVHLENLDSLDTTQVLHYAEALLPSDRSLFVVVDGIDECTESETVLLLDNLKRMLASNLQYRIFCSSRPDLLNRISASYQPEVKISMPEVNIEITEYIEVELERRLESGQLCLGDPSLILSIQDALLQGAQGM